MDAFHERLIVRAATIDELLSNDFEALPGQKADADVAVLPGRGAQSAGLLRVGVESSVGLVGDDGREVDGVELLGVRLADAGLDVRLATTL